MINFGDQLGNILYKQCDRIYTFSGEDLLILDSETMKLSQRINVGAEIGSFGVNGDVYILTKNGDFMVYTVDGKQLQNKHHKNKIFEHPILVNDHFLTHDSQYIYRVGLTCSSVYSVSSNINYLQYSTFKEQIIFATDKEIHIVGNEDRIIKLNQEITILKLDDENDLLACGLVNGALILLQFSTGIIVQSDHWHAHPINAMLFSSGSLYTAGSEGVIVQWHLKVARKVFYPRQGGEIVALQSLGDVLIANLKSINQIKQISLIGQNQLPQFNGIHNVYPNSFLNYQNKLLLPGGLGTIQLINPTQGTLIQTIPISQKNYTSNSGYSRYQTQIDQFIMMDRFLIVLLKSQYKQTLSFFENTNHFEFALLATTDYEIDGINAGFGSVITYGRGEIRVWKQVQQSKGQLVWNCIFRGHGYKGTKILTAKMIDETSIKIVTTCSILSINLQNNQVLDEIALDSNSDAAYINENCVVTCHDQTITFYSESKKQIKTQLGQMKSIQKLSDNLIAIYCDVALVVDLKQQKVLHGVQSQKLITTHANGRTLLYSYNHEKNQYKFVTPLTSERKASLMVEEQETANFEQIEQPEKPIIEVAAPLDPNVYRRLQLAKQARQIKELNLKEYLQMPSHQLPSLQFLAEKTQEVLRQDFSDQKVENIYSIEIDTEKGEQLENKAKIDLAQLKKLFK